MGKLRDIQSFVKQMAEALATELEFEILVIDDELNLIADTKRLEVTAQEVFPQGCLTDQMLDGGSYVIVEDPMLYPACQNCPNRNHCREKAAIVYPIRVEGHTIGTLGLCARSTAQRERLLRKVDQLSKVVDHLSVMLGKMINEKEASERAIVTAKQLETVINTIHEGIIAVDRAGRVERINNSAAQFLFINGPEITGAPITEIFPGLSLEKSELLHSGNQQNFNFNFRSRKKTIQLMGNVTPIGEDEKATGFVVSFLPAKEIKKIAGWMIGDHGSYSLDRFIGNNYEIIKLKEKIKKVALADSVVLIQGESGTGKELVARAIHLESPRRKGPFIAINCGAIPESLLESEFFGYEEGAFSGARRGGKPGKFELANGGTLFLDEIGDMPLHLQVKLLRVLEHKCFERVGGTEQVMVNVRIVAASNRDLETMVLGKEFREDLYFRLCVIPLTIPPLRERRDDIPLLIYSFINKYNALMNKSISGLTLEAEEILLKYSWSGNVRELENVIEYAMNMENADILSASSLPSRVTFTSKPGNKIGINLTVREVEAKAILEAIKKFGDTGKGKEKAAEYLGMSRATFYRKLKDIKSYSIR